MMDFFPTFLLGLAVVQAVALPMRARQGMAAMAQLVQVAAALGLE
jgi:hypothetical protein